MMPAEKKKAEQVVLRVIRVDFLEDFAEIYGVAVAAAEKHPEQVNNEIRNALTHLGRALTTDNITDAAENVRQARRHLERAKRDCLKLTIITKRTQLQSALFRIETTDGIARGDIKKRLHAIQKKRLATFIHEMKGSPVSAELEGIVADLLDVEEQIENSHADPGVIVSRAYRWFYKTRRFAYASSFAIVTSFLASYIALVTLPPDAEIVVHAKKVWSQAVGRIALIR